MAVIGSVFAEFNGLPGSGQSFTPPPGRSFTPSPRYPDGVEVDFDSNWVRFKNYNTTGVTVSFIVTVDFLDQYGRYIGSDKIGPITKYIAGAKYTTVPSTDSWSRNRGSRIVNVEPGY